MDYISDPKGFFELLHTSDMHSDEEETELDKQKFTT